MNHEYEKTLESRIDRELKSLPDIPAPSTLVFRVLAAIARPVAIVWYRLPWVMWPIALRAASLALLLGLFGGLCFAAWEVRQSTASSAAVQSVASQASVAKALFYAIGVVFETGALAVKQLGTGFFIAAFTIIGLGYFVCIGAGTLYVRLALARR